MENLPAWVAKVTSVWIGIGTFLVLLGTKVVGLPDWAPALFSEHFVQATMILVGAVINYLQIVRGIFATHPSSQAKTLSAGDKWSYALKPWKMAA